MATDAEDAAAALSGTTFQDRRFTGGELDGADLGDKDFTACTFRGVRLAETRWRGTRLEDCRFEDCDLSRMNPGGLSARDVVFAGCKLMGVDWSNLGTYPAMTFERCDLRYASVVKVRLRKIVFAACNLEEAQFLETDLAEASFADCRLAGARFERCDLRKVSFEGAIGLALQPAGNQLKGARIPADAAIRLAETFGLKVIS